MDCPPDYSTYSLDKLLLVSQHINREEYPVSAKKLDNEIAGRQRTASKNQQLLPRYNLSLKQNSSPNNRRNIYPNCRSSFRLQRREYFRIWIVNLALTLLTFGIFSAWAKVAKNALPTRIPPLAARRFSIWVSRSRFSGSIDRRDWVSGLLYFKSFFYRHWCPGFWGPD